MTDTTLDTPATVAIDEMVGLVDDFAGAASDLDAALVAVHTGVGRLMGSFKNLSAYVGAENAQLKHSNEQLQNNIADLIMQRNALLKDSENPR